MKRGLVVSWSGGKDSAMALHEVTKDESYRDFRLDGLLTTVTTGYERVSGHGVHVDLVEQQAQRVGLLVHKAYIPNTGTMDDYNRVMLDAYDRRRQDGVIGVVYGDIFLKGPKKAHLGILTQIDMAGVFPLWHRSTKTSVTRFIALGFQAIIICVNAQVLDASFLGRPLDQSFLDDLPVGVDPSGENGEYHTFTTYGPTWSGPVEYELAGAVTRDGQHFCDVRPA